MGYFEGGAADNNLLQIITQETPSTNTIHEQLPQTFCEYCLSLRTHYFRNHSYPFCVLCLPMEQ